VGPLMVVRQEPVLADWELYLRLSRHHPSHDHGHEVLQYRRHDANVSWVVPLMRESGRAMYQLHRELARVRRAGCDRQKGLPVFAGASGPAFHASPGPVGFCDRRKNGLGDFCARRQPVHGHVMYCVGTACVVDVNKPSIFHTRR